MVFFIYIPLCLYFNANTQSNGTTESTFTFHYVSILIFTRRFCAEYILYIYIPLCLYFNLCTHPAHRFYSRFTFHYVSILIVLPSFQLLRHNTFTFHYVSILISCLPDTSRNTWQIYIPLCLYFNFHHYLASHHS